MGTHSFSLSNATGIIGIFVILFIAYLFSNNRKFIKWRIVVVGLLLQGALCFFIRSSIGNSVFVFLAKCVNKLFSFANEGAAFVFGPLFTTSFKAGAQILPPARIAEQLNITSVGDVHCAFSFLYAGLVPIIFFGSVMGVLYHFGIMQKITKGIAYIFTKLLGISSSESLGVASCMFVGQSQAPLVLRPLLERLTDSELFLLMSAGMATVADSLLNAYQIMGGYLPYVIAASVLSAPGAIIMAKIMFPESKELKHNVVVEDLHTSSRNTFDAIARGAGDGWKVAVGVGIMLISILAFIAFLRYIVYKFSDGLFTLDQLIGYIFAPIAYLIGVPHDQIFKFSTLIGQKTVFNEFIAYSHLSRFFPNIVTQHGVNFIGISVSEHKAYMMAIFALTGFANFSSIAIQIGAIGELAPNRKSQVAALGLKALVAGVLANLLSATVVGILF